METIEGCFPPTVTIYNFGLIDMKFQKAEFTFEKSFTKGYYYMVTASVFDAKYQGSDNVLRNSD